MKIHIRFEVRGICLQPLHRVAEPFQVLLRRADAGQAGDFPLVGSAEFHEVLKRILGIGEVDQRSCLPEAVRVLHQDFPVAAVLHDPHKAQDRKAFSQGVSGNPQRLRQVSLRRQLFSDPDGSCLHCLQQAVHDKLRNLRPVVLDLFKLHVFLPSTIVPSAIYINHGFIVSRSITPSTFATLSAITQWPSGLRCSPSR